MSYTEPNPADKVEGEQTFTPATATTQNIVAPSDRSATPTIEDGSDFSPVAAPASFTTTPADYQDAVRPTVGG